MMLESRDCQGAQAGGFLTVAARQHRFFKGTPTMVAHEICPHCKEELPADAPEGLCPECLFRQSVAIPGAEMAPPDSTGPNGGGFVPPPAADLAQHFPNLQILEYV